MGCYWRSAALPKTELSRAGEILGGSLKGFLAEPFVQVVTEYPNQK